MGRGQHNRKMVQKWRAGVQSPGRKGTNMAPLPSPVVRTGGWLKLPGYIPPSLSCLAVAFGTAPGFASCAGHQLWTRIPGSFAQLLGTLDRGKAASTLLIPWLTVQLPHPTLPRASLLLMVGQLRILGSHGSMPLPVPTSAASAPDVCLRENSRGGPPS